MWSEPGSQRSARELLSALAERHPLLRPHAQRMQVAINGALAKLEAMVRDGDEVDVLPPVAGGSHTLLCEVRQEPLSVDEVMSAVRSPEAGAIAVFCGVVRNHSEGHPVARLDYEAHPTLADSQMRDVLTEVASGHHAVRLAALHRVGQLQVGELAVVLAASAPHREAAFSACRAAIEGIKASVPIWKREWGRDGSALWVNLEPGA